jgi:hypothetical protein
MLTLEKIDSKKFSKLTDEEMYLFMGGRSSGEDTQMSKKISTNDIVEGSGCTDERTVVVDDNGQRVSDCTIWTCPDDVPATIKPSSLTLTTAKL